MDETGRPCPATAYSDLGPNLKIAADNEYDQGVLDTADDRPTGTAEPLRFTVDLAKCTSEPLADHAFSLGVFARTARGENAATGLSVRIAGS